MKISQSELLLNFHYDPASGIFTRLCGPRRGKVCGSRMAIGYLSIHIGGRADGTNYYAHRLAWLYMKGEWPSNYIDHVNGDGTDNRWDNLRGATNYQNQGNSRPSRNNKCGLKGVSFQKGKYRARIAINRKEIPLGAFDCPLIAHKAYAAAAEKYFGEFARIA